MRKEAGMRFAKLWAGSAVALALGAGMAMAETGGHAVPWQMGLQPGVTPVAEFIHWFHNYLLLPIITVIVIAIPSFRLLYLQRDIPKGDMTIKVIGNPSWNWTYEYPDLGTNDDGSAKVSFTAFLKAKDKLEANDTWLLSTDVPVVVPVNKVVRLHVTADPEGIIHAWTIPAFGMKIDAIPGRLNEDWFQATKEGVYYGQCSELCGKDHAFMPIEVHVVSQADFDAWAAKIKTAGADEARSYLFALLKAEGQLAQK
jgi:cytochrome c oxidase subunit 2